MNNYVNPYFPNRKIRHAKLLVEAGFHINEAWYRDKKVVLCGVSKLIYWTNDDGINFCYSDYQQISLKTFLRDYAEAVKYNYKKKISINFPET